MTDQERAVVIAAFLATLEPSFATIIAKRGQRAEKVIAELRDALDRSIVLLTTVEQIRPPSPGYAYRLDPRHG